MTGPEAPSGRPRRTVPAGAFVVALMVAAALGVLAVVALATTGDGDDAADRDVRLAAGRFVERFLTFEHDALDDWKQGVLELTTRGFAEEVEDVESGLRSLIGEGQLDATTQVSDVFVGEEERGAVRVVVVYDRSVEGPEVDRTETDRYVELELIRVEGEWLVDDVVDLATGGDDGRPLGPDGAPTSAPTTAPTTTTGPGSTSTTDS